MNTLVRITTALAIASTSTLASTQKAAALVGDRTAMARRAFACVNPNDIPALDNMLHGNADKSGRVAGMLSTSGCRVLAKGQPVRIQKDNRGFACVITNGARSCLWVDSVWVTE